MKCRRVTCFASCAILSSDATMLWSVDSAISEVGCNAVCRHFAAHDRGSAETATCAWAGCDPFGATPAAATATSTIVLPTATPNLAQAAPKILTTWLSPIQNGPCPEACSTLKFTARGPVYIVVACNGFQQFADSAPTFEFTLYDANGHQADAFKQQCGDVNNDVVTNVVIPESLAAGPYTLSITNFPWECSVTIIDASRR